MSRWPGGWSPTPRRHVPPEGRGIGLMFQDFALFPHLSVTRNVAFGLSGPAAERAERARALLDRVGLGAPRRQVSRTSSPAASSSGWRWPGRWRRGRRSS